MNAPLRSLVLLVAATLAIATGGPARAQSASAALAGAVRTEDGRPVADAVVQARAVSTGTVRSAVSDARGRYRLDQLPPGVWTVVARMDDGRLSASSTVEVRLQQTVTLDFTVRGGPTELVRVRAEKPLVDRRQSAGELRVTSAQVGSLPLAGRDFTELALLDSSVRQAAPGNYAGERGSVFVINGQSGRSNSFLIDGLDNNDQTSGTTLNGFFSQQVIDEFVLMTHQFAPEFGRAAGGVVNVLTKRGANEPYREAFVQGTTRNMSEPGDFVTSLANSGDARDTAARFSAGASAGGALARDRAFYFVAYEHQSASGIEPYTGIDREGFARLGHKGYAGELEPAVGGGRVTGPARNDSLFGRLDFNLSARDTLMLRLSGDDRENRQVNIGDIRTPEAGFTLDETDLQLAAAWTRVLASGMINEVRLMAGTSALDQRANSQRVGVSRPSGIYGGNVLSRQDRDEDRFQVVQNLTWRKGAHLMKFGADLLRSRTRIAARFNPNGSLIYDYDVPYEPGDCGGLGFGQVDTARQAGTYPLVPCAGVPGIDDDRDGREGPGSTAYDCADGADNDGDGAADGDDLGCAAGIDEPGNILSYPVVFTRVNGEPESVLDDVRLGLFTQDRWEVGERWVLDYGLRYDVSTYELPGGLSVGTSIPNGGAKRDTDNLAPRFGFTFTPDRQKSLVVRGGAGVFYDKLVLAFPAVSALTSGTSIEFSFPQGLTCEVSEGTVEGTEPSPCELNTIFFDPLTLKFSTAPELDTPYTVQYTLGLERGLGARGAVSLDAIRALGYHLPLLKDLNPVICVPDDDVFNPDCPFVPIHPDQTTGSIAAIVSEGRSWYSGLDLGYRWQASESWFSASYTWSHAEDLGFDPLKNLISLPPDSSDLSRERGDADGSREHRLVLSGDFPLGWMGLRAAGSGQFSTGIPFNVTTGQDDNLDGILTDRPEGVGRNEGEDSPLAPINALREEVNALLGLGLEPIGSLHEPSFSQIDLRIYRRFASSRARGQGELYLQVFNVLDRENPGLIEGRAIARGFGETVTLAGPPRTLEVGLRLGY